MSVSSMRWRVMPDSAVIRLLERARDNVTYYGGSPDFCQCQEIPLSFDPEWNYNLPDPLSETHSKSFINAQGQKQGTCVHLGNCDIGCEVRAKNTLDLNYIPGAEQCGAEVRPLHVVRSIRPDGTGYRVMFDRIERAA